MNRNCLSYWFPKLLAAGLPVPSTRIVQTGLDLTPLCDGLQPDGLAAFLDDLRAAAIEISEDGPWFLRTGQGSGKHDWKSTCHLTDLTRLGHHVRNLVEWSHMVDFFGLAHDVWCVRELLSTNPVAVLPAYGNMPLVREVRAFVEDGVAACAHPYWPDGSIADGFGMPKLSPAGGVRGPSPHADAATLARAIHGVEPREAHEHDWQPILRQVAAAFAGDGAWSVDLLETRNGWYVTDMAVAERSYHWPGCANENRPWKAAD